MLEGSAWRFGRDINTDLIFPGWMTAQVKGLHDLSAGAMAGLDKDFHRKVRPGDFVVAEENFGCGSSRESAPLSLAHSGIRAVVAVSFGRIFLRNCVNLGLWPLLCPDAVRVETGHAMRIDLERGLLTDLTAAWTAPASPPDGAARVILAAGGLMEHLRANAWRY